MKAADLVAVPLELGSALRHRRVFHPVGVLAEGRLERVAAPGEGLPVETATVLGRVSKAVGLPGALPDLIGLAFRMPAGTGAATPWDVLMVSAGSGPLTRLTLRPTLTWSGTTLSTLMPLHRDDGWWWLTAELITELDAGLSMDAIAAAINADGLVFDVRQAHGSGPFTPLAVLTLTGVVPTDEDLDVSFDPTRNTKPGVALGPQWLTGLRARAYQLSRRGRDAPDEP